ncbi:Na+/H+ antiporter [Mycobacterium cookii]|uniref:Na+/H+ antiporter n=1 Tax=Mycobacterium cookii TaxID=1775 RepID=A0A7I7L2F7_9MYCO|nr:cation:proton antiporter [Mycobacterium cookii]MCV7329606.1 cation:proton antiporter [Mycobacterium cookii]BBX48555.1 Na+/H+ antiporter [Mycobacterium cookii]
MGLHIVLLLLLGAVGVIVAVHWIAERTGLPSAALLALGGIGYAFLPGPNVALHPEPVLYCILPPLLYYAALESSLVAIRRNMRAVISLSVALVLLTACSVGVAFGLLVGGATFAVGTVLGAAVAPPDPVAALAVARKVGLPPNIITLIEGEGLLNDATALTTLSVAIAAASGAGFSAPAAVEEFLLAAVGGFAVGAIIAVCRRLLSRWTSDILTLNAVSLATPFVAYLVAEEISASGVLAVVVCGLIVGHDLPRSESGASRLQTRAVWRLVNFLLEGFVFLLIGQQLPRILKGLDDYSLEIIIVAVAITLAVVLLVRPLWLLLTQILPRPLHTRLGDLSNTAFDGSAASAPVGPTPDRDSQRLSGRELFVLSWAGTRGVVSLAAIFTVPLVTNTGAPFPQRDLLLFCTLVVVLVTLIGQGLTFAPLARALGIRVKAADESRLRKLARVAAIRAALDRLDELNHPNTPAADRRAIDVVRQQLSARLAAQQQQLDVLEVSDADDLPAFPDDEALLKIRRAAIDAQREEMVRWRDAGLLADRSLRALGRALDHEEGMLTVSRPW